MDLTPEDYSSFCFLSKEDARHMAALASGIDEICAHFKDDVRDGFAEAKMIRNQKVAIPERNALESGQIYDQAINKAVKQLLCQSDAFLLKKWDTCSEAADYVLDLIAKQEEVKIFLNVADAKKPGAQAQHVLRTAAAMPEAARDTLDEMYDRMKEFVAMPLGKICDEQRRKLDNICLGMKTTKDEHAQFWHNAADKMGEGGEDDIRRFDDVEGSLALQLDRVKSTLHSCIDSVPDLYEMQQEYRFIQQSQREKH